MYYQQDTEVNLLVHFLKYLDNKHVIDVGAERGSFVQAALEAGADVIYAIEPYPPSVTMLQERFAHNLAVHILEMACGKRDEPVILHLVRDKSANNSDSFHTIIPFEETSLLRPVGTIDVICRTLDSLVREGTIPVAIGILKIDTERNDLAVLLGASNLASAVVMVEFWDDLPETVGAPAYHLSEVVDVMQTRGYAHHIVVKRHNEFEIVEMDSIATRPGDWGNAVFIHNTVFDKLASLVYRSVNEAQNRLLDKAMMYRSECYKRLDVIEEQRVAIAEQIQIIQRLEANKQALNARKWWDI